MINKQLTQNWGLTNGLRFLIVVLLVLGVFFRFVNLDRKVYWDDETYTSLRISGYTQTELLQQVFNGNVIGVEDLQKYQRTNPEKGLIDTVKSLAVDDPQHPPLYYVMLRSWVQLFGNSVAVTRSLSAVISLLVFPCIYWLCLELFESTLVGWVAIILISVSPFHVLYAQEAREYSLWTVMILLSGAALLRAMRLKTKLSWGVYALTVALGLYSFLFSGLVAIGHGVYVVATERFRLSKTVTSYLLASLAGLLAFEPWLFVVVTNLSAVHNTTNWMNHRFRLASLVKAWAFNLSFVFSDVQTVLDDPLFVFSNGRFGLDVPFNFVFVILGGYSIYFICCKSPQRIWLFLLTLMGVTALALIGPDLVLGGHRSSLARYPFPCYLGIQLAVAYLLSTQITFFSSNALQQKLWQLFMLTLISVGVLSCAISSQAETWWNKLYSNSNPPIAQIVNQATQPLLLSKAAVGSVLSLSYLLEPNVQLQLVFEPNTLRIPDSFSNIFLFDPFKGSRKLRFQIEKEQNYKTEPVYQGMHWLWKLAKP